MTRFLGSLLFLALCSPTPSLGQWGFLSEGSVFIAGDFAVKNGVLVSVCQGSSTCSDPLSVSIDGGATWRAEGVAAAAGHTGRNVGVTGNGFIFHGGTDQVYVGSADASSWTKVTALGSNSTSFFYDPVSDVVYMTTQSANLGLSRDGGFTWTDSGLVSDCDDELSFVHARGDVILSGYNQSCGDLHLSTDGGASWTTLGIAQPKAGFVAENGDLYVARNVNVSLVTPSTALFRSQDQGATWTRLHAAPGRGFQGRSTPLRLHSTIHVEGSTLLFTANDRVYLSTDNGVTWTDESAGITPDDTNGSAAVEFMIDGDQAYLLLFSTRDRGTSSGYGAYARPIAELSLSGGGTGTFTRRHEIPPTLELETPFPNPFRSETRLPYRADQAGPVRLSIVDVLGRTVAEEVLSVPHPGQYEYVWQAGDLPTGTYFMSISGGVGSATRAVHLRR